MWKSSTGYWYRLAPEGRRIKGQAVVVIEKYDHRKREWFFFAYSFAKLPVPVEGGAA